LPIYLVQFPWHTLMMKPAKTFGHQQYKLQKQLSLIRLLHPWCLAKLKFLHLCPGTSKETTPLENMIIGIRHEKWWQFCEYLYFHNLKLMYLSQDLMNKHCSVFVAHSSVPPVVHAWFVYFQLNPGCPRPIWRKKMTEVWLNGPWFNFIMWVSIHASALNKCMSYVFGTCCKFLLFYSLLGVCPTSAAHWMICTSHRTCWWSSTSTIHGHS